MHQSSGRQRESGRRQTPRRRRHPAAGACAEGVTRGRVMGIRASFRVVPVEAFAAVRADPNAELPSDGETFRIEKAWFNFHLIFRDEPSPLRFIIAGDLA